FTETAARIEKDGIALPAWIGEMKKAGVASFYKGDEVWDPTQARYVPRGADPRTATFEILRRGSGPVLQNDGAEAWDLDDGVLGVTFKTKANSIDPDVIKMLHEATARAERDFAAMVVSNSGEHFCVGANLALVLMGAMNDEYGQIREMAKGYQYATQRMKYATVPVVAAPYGYTFGGGLELCFGSAAVT